LRRCLREVRNLTSLRQKRSLGSFRALVIGSFVIFAALLSRESSANAAAPARFKGALVTPAQASSAKLKSLAKDGFNAAVLYLDDGASEEENEAPAERIITSKLDLYYWIEIARSPALASAHPEWMASIQTHQEWRRHFPNFPKPSTNQVVKNFPWVPALYEETFPVHLQRVEALIEDLPAPAGIFLNDLQGAPSACGCGNHFCRWTTDYGPLKTAKRLPADAAAKFLVAVGKLAPRAKIIPIWTTECAEHDKQAACGGVGCFTGQCWREYNGQLTPLAKQSDWIGVLLPFRDFPAAESNTGPDAEWQIGALKSFMEILPQRGGEAIPQGRVISVRQGWDTTPQQQQTQIQRSEAAGVAGWIVALTKIDQGWEPRMMTLKK
jgi:hypothetical protein